jgi:SAM-dependent methyltransferase
MAVQYGRRDPVADTRRYTLFEGAALQAHQERIRAMVDMWKKRGWQTLADRRMVEVGCGAGGILLDLLRLGARPEHLTGIELLGERVVAARANLPALLKIVEGDAALAPIDSASQDAVLAFTVFSSVLDDTSQETLAAVMWRWVAPGGGIMCYDFAVGNPSNPDVRGVPVKRLRQLFPDARLSVRRVTLAPPLARMLARVGRNVIAPASACMPFLKTHRLVWAQKS